MSYRELRDFTESMKILGYPRHLSTASFRSSNFELCADILYFLIHRYDPTIDLSDDISNEEKRIDFLKNCYNIVKNKSGIKLNIISLYKSDGFAVKELIKISNILYQAIQKNNDANEPQHSIDATTAAAASGSSSSPNDNMTEMQINSQLNEIKHSGDLVSEIVELGSRLFTNLTNEAQSKSNRDKALLFIEQLGSSTNLTSNNQNMIIENSIKQEITNIQSQITEFEGLNTQLEVDFKSLQTKLERKQIEIERSTKRFKSLQKLKPTFQDEYNHLEYELVHLYQVYIEKYRSLHYLEYQLADFYKQEEEEKMENSEKLKSLQRKIRSEALKILRGDDAIDENDEDLFNEEDEEQQEDDDDDDENEERDTNKHSLVSASDEDEDASDNNNQADGDNMEADNFNSDSNSENASSDGQESKQSGGKLSSSRPKGAKGQIRSHHNRLDENDEDEQEDDPDNEQHDTDHLQRQGARNNFNEEDEEENKSQDSKDNDFF